MPRCYKCGSPHHYSNNCSGYVKQGNLKCYGCGGNHKRENCPNHNNINNSNRSSSSTTLKCFQCNQIGHKRDTCPQLNNNNNNNTHNNNVNSNSNNNNNIHNNNILQVADITLQFDGWWGKKSVFIHPNCILTILKTQIVQKLINTGKISNDDVDTRNQIAHVAICKDENDTEGTTIHDQLNNRVLNVSIDSFQITNDCIMLPVGHGKHCSLFYKTGLKNLIGESQIKQILHEILLPYYKVQNVEIKEEQPEEKKSNNKDCCVCADELSNTLLEPCNHLCVCESCSTRLMLCPICRSNIENKKTIFRV